MNTAGSLQLTCRWCGRVEHAGKCYLVKAIEYFEDGRTVKRVEFFEPTPIAPLGNFTVKMGPNT